MFPVPPPAGASLMGWVTLTASANVLPSCYTILRRTGHEYSHKPIVALQRDDRTEALAAALGSPPAEVTRRLLLRSPIQGFVVMDGVTIRSAGLITHVRRFAPSTLAETHTHLSAWMVRFLPFCPRSFEYLMDSCSKCGTVQTWRHAGDQRRCDACCADLTRQRSPRVAEALRPALADLAALVAGRRPPAVDRMPPAVRALDDGELLELTLAVAIGIDPELPRKPSHRTDVREQRHLAETLARAWALLPDFPRSVMDAAAVERGRTVRTRVASVLLGTDRISVMPRVAALLAGAHDEAAAVDDEDIRIKEAVRVLGCTESELLRAREEGDFEERHVILAGCLRRSLRRSEVEHVARIRAERLSVFAVGEALGMPAYGVRALIAAGDLATEAHPYVDRRDGGPVATETTLADLRRRLARRSVRLDDGVALRDVMRCYGGGPKPWARVFRMLLDGSMAFSSDADRPDARSITIGVHDAETVLRMPAAVGQTSYSQLEALEILNLASKHGARIAGLAQSGVGNRGCRNAWSVAADVLHEAAGRHMSTSELTMRTDESIAVVSGLLRDRGAREPSPLGWLRDDIWTCGAEFVLQHRPL